MGFRDSAPLSDLKATPSPPPPLNHQHQSHHQPVGSNQIGNAPYSDTTNNATPPPPPSSSSSAYPQQPQQQTMMAPPPPTMSSAGGYPPYQQMSSPPVFTPGFQQQQPASYAPADPPAQQHHFMPPAPVPPASVGATSAQQQQPPTQFFNPNSQQQPLVVQQQQHPPSASAAFNNQPYQQQQMPGTTSTTVRGRERYCSGGAWVGPAPAWPTPPATCSVETCDFSRVKPEYAKCCETFRKRYKGLFGGNNSDSNSVSFAKKKELEVVSRKIGGLFYLMGKDISEENGAVTHELGVKLNDLASALERMDFATVNAVLLDIGAKHWEEAVYWYPGLKRIVKQ